MTDSVMLSSEIDQKQAIEEEKNCSNCGKFERLRHLSEQAVINYEELQTKYEQSKEQYNNVQKELQKKDAEIQELKKRLAPVEDEYENLKEKYNIEVICREEAESYASKVTKQNKVLKRQSVDFLSSTGGEIPIDGETDPSEEYRDQLNSKIEELEEEIGELRSVSKGLRENWEYEKNCKDKLEAKVSSLEVELQQCLLSLEEHKESVSQLTQDRERLCQDYEELQTKYNKEFLCKDKAEKFASQLHAQTAAIKRESNILMLKAAPNEKLMKALVDIEDLTNEMTEQKQKYEAQILELQEKISELSDQTQLEELQQENEAMVENNKQLSSRIDKLDSQYKEIQDQYKELEKKYDAATRPPPPPPPPPLPAALHGQMKGGYLKRQSKKKLQNLNKVGVKMNDSYQSAIDEMMKRIQIGTALSKTLKPVRMRIDEEEDDCIDGKTFGEFPNYVPRRHASESNVLSPVRDGREPFVRMRHLKPNASFDAERDAVFDDKKKTLEKQKTEELNPKSTEKLSDTPSPPSKDSVDRRLSADVKEITCASSQQNSDEISQVSQIVCKTDEPTTSDTSINSSSRSSKSLTMPENSLKLKESSQASDVVNNSQNIQTSITTDRPYRPPSLDVHKAQLESSSRTIKPRPSPKSPPSSPLKKSYLNRNSRGSQRPSSETGSKSPDSPKENPWNVKLKSRPPPDKQNLTAIKDDEKQKLPRKGTVMARMKQFSQ